MNIAIRVAKVEDAEKLLGIYSYYVKNTAVSFEYEVPSVEEFEERIRNTLCNYPYLVAEADGEIVGYAYAGRFRARAAYTWSAEISIYIDKRFHGAGIGKRFYMELESILKRQNVINIYTVIADPVEEDEFLTRNSEGFHKAMGYELVARYHQCGSKFGRWYNIIEMEKIIGERTCPPREFIPYVKIKGEI